MLTNEEKENLFHQVILTIQNEGDWYAIASKYVAADNVVCFLNITGSYIPKSFIRMSYEARAYVYSELWAGLGGDEKVLLNGVSPILKQAMLGLKEAPIQHGKSTLLKDLKKTKITGLRKTASFLICDGHSRWTEEEKEKIFSEWGQYVPYKNDDVITQYYNDRNHNQKEPTMNTIPNAPAFETRHYVFGNEASSLTDAQLIDAIRKIENEIADLGTVKTESSKITAKIKDLNTMLSSVVGTLDAR